MNASIHLVIEWDSVTHIATLGAFDLDSEKEINARIHLAVIVRDAWVKVFTGWIDDHCKLDPKKDMLTVASQLKATLERDSDGLFPPVDHWIVSTRDRHASFAYVGIQR